MTGLSGPVYSTLKELALSPAVEGGIGSGARAIPFAGTGERRSAAHPGKGTAALRGQAVSIQRFS